MSEGKLLQDKVVVVTGGGGAIGRGISLLAAQQGAKVVVNDLGGGPHGEGEDSAAATKVVKEIEGAGGEAVANFDSVADWDGAHRLIDQAVDQFGRIDVVINNAGILRDVIFHKMTEEDFGLVVDVNLKGSFNVSRAAATHFRAQESGAFVHMTSTSGLIGNFGQANYGASKLALVGLSKCIALDMERYNVRSNCIAPFAWSRLIGTIPQATPEQRDRVKKIQQMTPEKVAPFTVALISDGAQDVTGQVFGVRRNEIFLFNQTRPVRGAHRSEGWTAESVLEHAIPALKPSFMAMERSADIFSWDPV